MLSVGAAERDASPCAHSYLFIQAGNATVLMGCKAAKTVGCGEAGPSPVNGPTDWPLPSTNQAQVLPPLPLPRLIYTRPPTIQDIQYNQSFLRLSDSNICFVATDLLSLLLQCSRSNLNLQSAAGKLGLCCLKNNLSVIAVYHIKLFAKANNSQNAKKYVLSTTRWNDEWVRTSMHAPGCLPYNAASKSQTIQIHRSDYVPIDGRELSTKGL